MMGTYEIAQQAEANMPKRVAAYCRVSTDKADQGNSFASQQRYFKDYIANMPNWVLYEVFADEGVSGTSTKKRKAFNRMIACAQAGAFDIILTKEISRFARNTLDSLHYTRTLKQQGVGVVFMNDNINTLDADGELRLTIMASIAQEESRKISERVKWGQKRQMEQGVVFGRSLLGYNVCKGKLFVNEAEAAVVRLIFCKFVEEGKGSYVIARELNEAGIPPMCVQEWSNTVVLRVLRNEKYCGDLVQKKTYTPDFLSHDKKYNRGQEALVTIRDHHQPIISRATFEAANRMLAERASLQEGKTRYSNRYFFSGKIKCGVCGKSYVARCKSRKQGQYKAWRCLEGTKNGQQHVDKTGQMVGCNAKSLRNEDVVAVMQLVCKSLVLDRAGILKKMMTAVKFVLLADIENTKMHEKKLEDAHRKQKRLLDLYLNGAIEQAEFVLARQTCNSNIAKLQTLMQSTAHKPFACTQRNQTLVDIAAAIGEMLEAGSYDESFYGGMLEKMIVQEAAGITVCLKRLPYEWNCIIAK